MKNMQVVFLAASLCVGGAAYASSGLNVAIDDVRQNCADISDELADMKKMAGINTAVTGVGTAAGGVALGTGIAKAGVDRHKENISALVSQLESAGAKRITTQDEFVNIISRALENAGDQESRELAAALRSQRDKLAQKSQTLGNIRTGTLAANTATNIAGAAIAGSNRIKGDLQSQIDACIASVDDLTRALGQARMAGTDSDADIGRAQRIVTECGMWTTVDLSPINRRARNATVASSVGAGVDLAGTIVSAMANSKPVRDDGGQKEKNLNTAANVMAGGATVSSATATIFNATQISAIKRAATVADECEGALR